jgi:ribosomal-protein-alanine N-acetyltransferase
MSETRAPLKNPMVIATTQRLILRSATESDIPILHERVFGDPEVMRLTFDGIPMTPAEAEDFMRKYFTFGDSLVGIATLTERPDGEIIGFSGLFPCDLLGAADFEIGFVLARRAWGRGIATEIGKAQLELGFGRVNCGRLLGLAEPRNAASIRALGKLGMRYLKDITKPAGGDRSIFVIEASEWARRSE